MEHNTIFLLLSNEIYIEITFIFRVVALVALRHG